MQAIQSNMQQGTRRRAALGRPSRRDAGFSMIELLIAMGIFTLGFIAVASIFPVAAVMQKRTIEDIKGVHVLTAAAAAIQAEPLELGDITDGNNFHTSHSVHLTRQWRYHRRGFPTMIPETSAGQRDFYWVPMLRYHQLRDEVVVNVVALRRDASVDTYTKLAPAGSSEPNGVPGVARISITGLANSGGVANGPPDKLLFGNNPRLVLAGDQIIDSLGYLHTVKTDQNDGVIVFGFIPEELDPADPTKVLRPDAFWYVKRPNPTQPSPLVAATSLTKKAPAAQCWVILDSNGTSAADPGGPPAKCNISWSGSASQSGAWNDFDVNWGADGYNGDVRVRPVTQSVSTQTWEFTGLKTGIRYRVGSTWTVPVGGLPGNPAVSYTIYWTDAGGPQSLTVSVDQSTDPSPDEGEHGGSPFQRITPADLGPITSGTITVEANSGGPSGRTVLDAVMVKSVDAITP